MLKVGIISSGQIAEAHIRGLQNLDYFQLQGIYDFDSKEQSPLQKKYHISHFNSLNELIDHCDVVDIIGEDIPHFDIASQALRKSCHVFIDRPLMSSLPEAHKLIDLAFEADVKVQIGRMERFNPAYILAFEHIHQPNYIEAKREQPITDNNPHVVLDMMIQDIDIILSLANSGIKKIQARGHGNSFGDLMMVNAHIVFDNGCIANLTSSKITENTSAHMHIYQETDSLAIDLHNNRVQHFSLHSKEHKHKSYLLQNKETCKPIELELESFYNSIINDTTPNMSLVDGSQALEVAYSILDRLAYWQDIKVEEPKLRFGN
ncbi:MAG: hypothetical protein DSY76_01370 [Bacteroidetes bacterium]|nr:MAG: hypothetical protein DSY76_01370 [Bacteroidota bacterium]